MSLTKHLALIASTERLWPHDSVDQNGNAVVAFGLNLITAIVPTPGTATPLSSDDITLAKPWSWDTLTDLVLLAQRGAGTFKPLASKVTVISISVTDPQKKQMVAAIDSRVAAMRTSGPGIDPDAPFLWDPVNPKADEAASYGLFRHLLGSTSTTPAPVPYALNLAICFTVNLLDIDPAFVDTGKIATDTVLLVAPRFQVSPPALTKQIKVTPSQTSSPTQFPDTTSVMWLWPCDVTDSANNPVATPAVSAYTVKVELTPPARDLKKSLLDLTSYWVVNDNKNVSSTDWSTQLAGQIADVWNLPRLLLDAIPGLVAQSLLTQPERYWETILVSMHDRASVGWIDSPDGTGLLRFALARAAAAKADPRGDKSDPRGTRPASWQALQDGWARSLRSRLRRHDMAMSLTTWQNALLNLLPDLRGKFPAGPTTPNSAAPFSFLERLLATLGNNRFLKQLLIDGDGSGAKPGFWPQAFSSDAPPSVKAQAADEDFIENTVTNPTPPGTFADSGTLTLSDGATWAITLGNITVPGGTPWDGLAFSLVLNDRPAGTGPFPLRIAVTQAHDGAATPRPILKFHLTDVSSSPLGDFVSPALPDPTPPYHIRVLINRDTSSAAIGKKSAFALTLQVSTTAVAQGTPPVWQNATGPSGSIVPGTAHFRRQRRRHQRSGRSGHHHVHPPFGRFRPGRHDERRHHRLGSRLLAR